jgi:mannose-6-phosphate isomerase-like protein (cupin superfamily)
MAYKSKIIHNPVTRQEIKFLQTSADTGGRLLEMEATWYCRSKEPVPHYHPYQEEDFSVISGELTVRLGGGDIRTLRAGDRIHISVNQVHSMWNAGEGRTVVNWQVRRALDTELLLETMHGLAADGKTNSAGMPNILQIAVTADKFSNILRPGRPSFATQRVLFFLLKPLALLLGYRPTYSKYLD